MQAKVILYLHANNFSHPSWAIHNDYGEVIETIVQGEPSILREKISDAKVCVLVPAVDVVWLTANLPKTNRNQLMQLIPFALEEELIDELDNLHFIPANQRPGEKLAVGVVSHKKMQAWQDWLHALNIQAQGFYSAALALPLTENVWQLAVTTDEIVVRISEFNGFACEKINLVEMLTLAISKGSAPEKIIVQNYTEESIVTMLSLTVPLQVVPLEEIFAKPAEFVPMLAKNIAAMPSLNLLHGKYALRKTKLPHENKLKHIAFYLSITLGILLVMGPVISNWILQNHLKLLDQQIAEIYKSHFPNASAIVAPRLRMEEKLQNVTKLQGENRLLSLLSYVGEALQREKNLQLRRFNFQNNQLTLELTATTSAELSNFMAFLQAKDLRVKQQSANLSTAKISVTLLIE